MNCTIRWNSAGLLYLSLLIVGCDQEPTPPPSPVETVAVSQSTYASATPQEQDFKSRYDRPTNPKPAPSAIAPLGHTVAVAGYDLRDPAHPRLAWMDPADNLANGKGVHRWSVAPAEKPVQFNERGLLIEIDHRHARIFGMVLVESHSNPNTNPPSRLILQNMPDLSQHAGLAWQNFCAPAAVADVLFSLRSLDAGLNAHLPIHPSRLADTAASECIAGLAAPPLRPGSLAQLMQTSQDGGTTAQQIVSGLEAYLSANAQDPQAWYVHYVAVDKSASAISSIELIQRVIASGGGVILTLHWVNLGEDKPADSAEPPVVQAKTEQPSSNSSENTNTTSQAVESAARFQSRQVDMAIPMAPQAIKLPPIQGIVKTKQVTSGSLTISELNGRWLQVSKNHTADFAPGGYQKSDLFFGRDGILQVTRHYGTDGQIVLTQRFIYEIAGPQTLLIKSMNKSNPSMSNSSGGFLSAAISIWTDKQVAVVALPVKKKFRLDETRLELMNKTYHRSP